MSNMNAALGLSACYGFNEAASFPQCVRDLARVYLYCLHAFTLRSINLSRYFDKNSHVQYYNAENQTN